jgi:hypothetical protein
MSRKPGSKFKAPEKFPSDKTAKLALVAARGGFLSDELAQLGGWATPACSTAATASTSLRPSGWRPVPVSMPALTRCASRSGT